MKAGSCPRGQSGWAGLVVCRLSRLVLSRLVRETLQTWLLLAAGWDPVDGGCEAGLGLALCGDVIDGQGVVIDHDGGEACSQREVGTRSRTALPQLLLKRARP